MQRLDMRSAVLFFKRFKKLPVKAHEMRIEILYFDGCPNRRPAVEALREVLREEGVSAEIVEVNVGDALMARKLTFLAIALS